MNNTDTNLIEALTLARLPANERFDIKNITKIHNGLKPHYKLLTGYDLPDDVIIVGYGSGSPSSDPQIFDWGDSLRFDAYACGRILIYYTRTSTAIEKGWWRKPIKWIVSRPPTKDDAEKCLVAIPAMPDGPDGPYYKVGCELAAYYRQPWQTIANADKMTPEELADIPEQFRWEGK